MKLILVTLAFLGVYGTALASPIACAANSASNVTVAMSTGIIKAAPPPKAASTATVPAAPVAVKPSSSPRPRPRPPPPPPLQIDPKAQAVSKAVVAVGGCSQDCWNESAADAGCDPNTDDDCLCGPFFDNVTSCVSSTCDIGENLQVLNMLDTACGL